MNPVEMPLCRLGACRCIVVRAFARAKGIDFQDFRIEREGDLDTDGFLKGKNCGRAGLRDIRYSIPVRTDADEEKDLEFADFAKNRCPVNDFLPGHVPIVQKGIVITK